MKKITFKHWQKYEIRVIYLLLLRTRREIEYLRSCWNRQTGTFEGRVSADVWVQVPSTAPWWQRINFDTKTVFFFGKLFLYFRGGKHTAWLLVRPWNGAAARPDSRMLYQPWVSRLSPGDQFTVYKCSLNRSNIWYLHKQKIPAVIRLVFLFVTIEFSLFCCPD